MNAGNQNWTSKIKELNDAVTHHVQEEENKVFSAAQKVLSQDKKPKRYLNSTWSFRRTLNNNSSPVCVKN
jgi:hypothetical protein